MLVSVRHERRLCTRRKHGSSLIPVVVSPILYSIEIRRSTTVTLRDSDASPSDYTPCRGVRSKCKGLGRGNLTPSSRWILVCLVPLTGYQRVYKILEIFKTVLEVKRAWIKDITYIYIVRFGKIDQLFMFIYTAKESSSHEAVIETCGKDSFTNVVSGLGRCEWRVVFGSWGMEGWRFQGMSRKWVMLTTNAAPSGGVREDPYR